MTTYEGRDLDKRLRGYSFRVRFDDKSVAVQAVESTPDGLLVSDVAFSVGSSLYRRIGESTRIVVAVPSAEYIRWQSVNERIRLRNTDFLSTSEADLPLSLQGLPLENPEPEAGVLFAYEVGNALSLPLFVCATVDSCEERVLFRKSRLISTTPASHADFVRE